MSPKAAPQRTRESARPEYVSVNALLFDSLNPRLTELGLGQDATQEQILETLWNLMAVDEIAWSIAKNGYFSHEPFFVERKDGKLIVIEGNRRLAAIQLLLDEEKRDRLRATALPRISRSRAAEIAEVPVIFSTRKGVWEYLGFKHVNGPAMWGSYAKAQYIARVRNEFGVSLRNIAEQIGDRHATVQRLYWGWVILEQAEKAKLWDRGDRYKKHLSFSHLYTGLNYEGFRSFLGLTEARGEQREPVPADKLKGLGELCEWLFGSRTKDKKPVIVSQNPDLRNLDEVLQNKSSIDALRAGLPLEVALDISRGDERIFREALQSAKNVLQRARGTLSTGYAGEEDLFRTAEEIVITGNDLYEEMDRIRRRRLGRGRLIKK